MDFKEAIYNNDIEKVKILLQDKRIDPSVKNYAIRLTASRGQVEIVKLLLEDPRVDPTVENDQAIRYAAANGHTEVVKVFLQDKRVDPSTDNNEAIRWAANNGHTEVVKVLLQDDRVDPSADNNYPIRSASERGRTEIVKVLLKDKRVDPAADNNYAIRFASENGHTEIVKALLQDERVDWRSIQDNNIVQDLLNQNNNDIESRLAQSYLLFSEAGPKTILDNKEKSLFPKKIRRNISDLGVYEGFYEEYCSNIPENLKIPPMKLILIADKLKIKYNRDEINWSELCTKIRIRLNHFLD